MVKLYISSTLFALLPIIVILGIFGLMPKNLFSMIKYLGITMAIIYIIIGITVAIIWISMVFNYSPIGL